MVTILASSNNHSVISEPPKDYQVEQHPFPNTEASAVTVTWEFVELKSREDYVTDFFRRRTSSAREILEMCRIVYEAKKKLSGSDFESFCLDIGYSSKNSTIRKFVVVGGMYIRLILVTDRLPASWTSIYQYCQLKSEDLDSLLTSNRNLKDLKGKELKGLLASIKNQQVIPLAINRKKINLFRSGYVYFTKKELIDVDRRLLMLAIDELEMKFPFIKISFDNELV